MGVYGLVPGAKRHSPDHTQLSPGRRICSFISHLNSPGRIKPRCHFRRTELFTRASLYCPTSYPLTPESRECTCGQSALPIGAQLLGIIQPSLGSNPRSLACKSRTLLLSHDTLHSVHWLHEMIIIIIIITYSYKAQNPTIVAQCTDVLMVKVSHGVYE